MRNPEDVAAWLERLGRQPRLIRERTRPVPLEELPIENLPRVAGVEGGFGEKLGAGVLAAGLAPLLVFAPRRAEAEKIARKLAVAAPLDKPIPLRPEDERILGRELAGLVRHRVAYHHSGLSYAARAGWIEPLAKNGHLRFIVATTGLAAGINFSVRSVLVTDTTYQDGPFTRELRPDELLQMFGRAGRRGLDSLGCVIVARNSPSLLHAAPRQLRRVNELDWPTLLRVMEEAVAHGEPPLPAAEAVGARLFSRQTVGLGFEHAAAAETTAPERFGPTREEFLDSTGAWQPLATAHRKSAPLATCLARRGEQWLPALRVAAVAESHGPGRLCKLRDARGFHYGKEMPVARREPMAASRLCRGFRKKLHLRRDERFSDAEFLAAIAPLLDLGGAAPIGLVARGNVVALQLELGEIKIGALVDSHQRPLLDPPQRRVALAAETHYGDFRPRAGTPAHAWRKLGLVDAEGRPTARGRVFNRFQAGEGLMVAAALEDAHYPLEELVLHLANLRGGARFHDHGGPSERFATASRAIYGHVDHEGYLRAGSRKPTARARGKRSSVTSLAARKRLIRGEARRCRTRDSGMEKPAPPHRPRARCGRHAVARVAGGRGQCLEARATGENALIEPLVPIALRRRAAETPMRANFASRR